MYTLILIFIGLSTQVSVSQQTIASFQTEELCKLSATTVIQGISGDKDIQNFYNNNETVFKVKAACLKTK